MTDWLDLVLVELSKRKPCRYIRIEKNSLVSDIHGNFLALDDLALQAYLLTKLQGVQRSIINVLGMCIILMPSGLG